MITDLNVILKEWAYRVDNGKPNPKNGSHIYHLKEILIENKWPFSVIDKLLYNLTEQETKYTLQKFALKYLPNDIVYRSKQMFTVPIGEWFKTKLKNYLKKIVLSDSLDERNIFDRTYLEKMVDSHIAGSKDFTRELRAITNLEIWFREFLD